MKIRSNLPPRPTPQRLEHLSPGDVFRLSNNSLESVVDGHNPVYIRGAYTDLGGRIPATGLDAGTQTDFEYSKPVWKVNATLLIEP